MKSFIQTFSNRICLHSSSIICLVYLGMVFSCTRVKQDEIVVPPDPFLQPIGRMELELNEQGVAMVGLEKLKINPIKPFSFKSFGFKHGEFKLSGDSALIFVGQNSPWKADSGTIEVCQNGPCKSGFLKVKNPRILSDTVPPRWLKGTPLPTMAPVLVGDFG